MTKFYVRWGEMRRLLVAGSAREAADIVVKGDIEQEIKERKLENGESVRSPKSYPAKVIVSEKGYEDHNDDFIFDTINVIYQLNQINLGE